MMKILLTYLAFLISPLVCAQVGSSKLSGEWIAANNDSLYYKSDAIELHQDANYYIRAKTCEYVYWQIGGKRNLRIEDHFVCTEPGQVRRQGLRETYKITGTRQNQVVKFYRDGKLIDKFQVMDYKEVVVETYPYDTKVLKVKRLK